MSIVGKNIARRRKELRMTQEELALKMGYKSKSTINKIELGINDIVQSKVVKFAEVLRTTPSELMGWVEMQKNNDIITDAVVKMRTDPEFFSLVECLMNLDSEKQSAIKQMALALQK